MSNSIVKDEEFLKIPDCKKSIKKAVNGINKINILLRDPNSVGKKREELAEAFTASVEQLVDITAAGLINNVLEEDEYNILQAKVDPKVFKNCAGHVNSIVKTYITKKQNIPLHSGAEISSIELAKLIKTPYSLTKEGALNNHEELKEERSIEEQKAALLEEGYDQNQMKQVDSMPKANEDSVVTISSTGGEEVIVDKEEGAIYMTGNVDGKMTIWKKKIVSTATTWYETAKNVAIAMFKLVWSIVASVGSSLIGGVVDVGKAAVGVVTNTGSGIIKGGKKFWHSLKSANKDAKETTMASGKHYTIS